jgi:hypothetical protein
VSSSDPQPPVRPGGPTPPSTQEIPVAQPVGATAVHQLPPHPNAVTPAPVQPMGTPVPTGPVDFVPGLPAPGTPPPPPPVPPTPAPATAPTPAASARASAEAPAPTWPEILESDTPADGRSGELRARRPRDRAALIGLGLVALAVALLELGLTLDFGAESYWSTVPLWSGFATVCALLVFAAFSPTGDRLRSGSAWRVAAGGLVGVAVFWLLVVLPVVDTDRGFVLTAALAALGGALWVGTHRNDASRKD